VTLSRNQEADAGRRTILLPDGRSVSGFLPGFAARRGRPSMDLLMARRQGCPPTETVEEYRVRDDLARQLGGLTEAALPLGFADVLTSTAVFEVEPRHSWREGARQALAYSAQCGLPPALALFRAIPREEMLTVFTELRAINLHGLHADFIHLWWWTGQAWQEMISSALCANMPQSAIFGSCSHCGRRVARFDTSGLWYDYDSVHPISQLHCCTGQCASAHEGVEWCLQWAERRAFPTRRQC
jgi:hypothetical protein